VAAISLPPPFFGGAVRQTPISWLQRFITAILFLAPLYLNASRIQPPQDFLCPAGDVALMAGAIASATTSPRQLELTILTDWETREIIRLVTPILKEAVDVSRRSKVRPASLINWLVTEKAAHIRIWRCGSSPRVMLELSPT
jgi:hypothetical protein